MEGEEIPLPYGADTSGLVERPLRDDFVRPLTNVCFQ